MASIVLFDGVCNFCNDSVNFIIRRDHHRKFRFAPLQSEIGQQMLLEHGIGADVDSIVLIEDGRAYTRSTAALRIARTLGGALSLGFGLVIIPSFIRDWFYKVFARNRYRLFGRKDVCMMPTADVRERFL